MTFNPIGFFQERPAKLKTTSDGALDNASTLTRGVKHKQQAVSVVDTF